MHLAVKRFIKDVRKELPHKFRNRTVLEVGSHNINGSPRKYFWFCKYTGIDISKGKGVDIECSLSEYFILYNNTKFQVVISTEVMEHDKYWERSLRQMYDLLENKGLLLITSAGPHRMEHGTKRTLPECSPDTTDYYRNISIEDFKSILPEHLFSEYVIQYGRGMNDLYFYGIKKEFNPTSQQIYKALKNS